MSREVEYDWNDVDNFSRWVRNVLCLVDKRPECVIGILNGGAIPALIVSNYFKVPLYWVQMKSYRGRRRRKPQIKYVGFSPVDVIHKHIMVVDEIVDSGSTIESLASWLSCLKIKSVTVAVMISKLERIIPEVSIHRMLQKSKDEWCIFPWESV